MFFKNNLIAFIEIDGETHYKQKGKLLKRKDKLKEHLYHQLYPNISYFRIRSNQAKVIGINRSGYALAKWILNSLQAEVTNKDIEYNSQLDYLNKILL